jgi:hypothetical protein
MPFQYVGRSNCPSLRLWTAAANRNPPHELNCFAYRHIWREYAEQQQANLLYVSGNQL